MPHTKGLGETLGSTHVTVAEHLVHVDALSVENHLLLARLGGAFAEEAARQAPGLHDDSVLGQLGQDRRQVKVHLADRQDQLHLVEEGIANKVDYNQGRRFLTT